MRRITETLKLGYTKEDLLNSFKSFYPIEWGKLKERQEEYRQKDQFLKRTKGRTRYHPQSAEDFFYSLPKVKYLLSDEFRIKHRQSYNEEQRCEKEKRLIEKQDNKVEKTKQRVDQYIVDMQEVDPGFIDALIYAYHTKDNSTNDKLEIFKEIQKYDCEKTVRFFYQLNDSERNNKIRKLAFEHLQRCGRYVKLRQSFKGKKKKYQIEMDTFYGTSQKLYEKLTAEYSIQQIKKYDLFISHSSLDKELVRKVVDMANNAGMNCYVDWTADNDFLKRSMVSDYTSEVLKTRMEHSSRLLYLSTSNSRKSPWVAFELNYYQNEVKREILMIIVDGNDVHSFRQIGIGDLKK